MFVRGKRRLVASAKLLFHFTAIRYKHQGVRQRIFKHVTLMNYATHLGFIDRIPLTVANIDHYNKNTVFKKRFKPRSQRPCLAFG